MSKKYKKTGIFDTDKKSIYETPQYLTTCSQQHQTTEAAGNRLEPCTNIAPHLQGAAPQHTITQRPEQHTHTAIT